MHDEDVTKFLSPLKFVG